MSDGAEYSGEFAENQPNGQGVQTWPDGRRFDGSWKNGQMNGEGIFVWKDG